MVRKNNVIIGVINGFVVELPTPVRISYFWNFGSMLAFCLIFQIVTGLFLSFHYRAHLDYSFLRVIHVSRDVSYGWLIHFFHSNGARIFFICLYFHVGRGLYYSLYRNFYVWMRGVVIFFFVMITAFLGYVLPWGQISFWGATVITNLLSVIPYFGNLIVEWLWGGFSVSGPTLIRFFALHFLFPFILIGLVFIHLLFLHEVGSMIPLGFDSDVVRVEFHSYFGLRDVLGLIFMVWGLMILVIFFPNILGDRENFILADYIKTPEHIQPEWYFLFAYAVLRSIPNKMGGVIGLVMSISVLFTGFLWSGSLGVGKWFIIWRSVFWFFVVVFILLTWIGARSVEDPYIIIGQVLTASYFGRFLMILFIHKLGSG